MFHSKPKQQSFFPKIDVGEIIPAFFSYNKKTRLVTAQTFVQIVIFLIGLLLVSNLAHLQAQTIGFGSSSLTGTELNNPTSLQFGPDGRLYVAQQNGIIKVFTIQRNSPNNYSIVNSQQIDLIAQMPNRNDDGSLNPSVWGRQVTGILVVGTAQNPIIYICSSDPRIGAGPDTGDSNLDTNSGILSRLNWTGSQWVKTDLVRGLPRSEENHAANGLVLDPATNILYIAQGGNTNMGALSANFVFQPEYALSAAILAINLTTIGNTTYDLPTLDDETRTNTGATPGFTDPHDPFGGNNGKNQAVLAPNGPVQVYSPGFRNPYDLVITQSGKMYTFDNGPNGGWGGPPTSCIYAVSEPGTSEPDNLHLITGAGYYGGHPNLTRANRNNTFNASNPQSPIPAGMENPSECTYIYPTLNNNVLLTSPTSTNGLCEYTANNFGGAMKGNLLAVTWSSKVLRIRLNAAGTAVVPGGATDLFTGLSSLPLDIVAQGDNGPFPGTIWTANVFGNSPISIFEPNDYDGAAQECNPNNLLPGGDADADGFTNADELLNNTNPCSAASKPADNDGDFISDMVDTDDDNDGTPDVNDPFATDSQNGANRFMPVAITWDNDGTQAGGIANTGFTGLMANGITDYLTQYNINQMTIGGAAGVLTIDNVPSGDALATLNSQQYAFQLGVNVQNVTTPYTLRCRIKAPFAGITTTANQSMGMYIGTGMQNNYLKIVISAAGSNAAGIQVLHEVNNAVAFSTIVAAPVLGAVNVDLFLTINPADHTVQPAYAINGAQRVNVGSPIVINAAWLNVMAMGIIATSGGSGQSFPATWDFIDLKLDPLASNGAWQTVNCNGFPNACSSQLLARRDNGFVQSGNRFYLLGGRTIQPVSIYDPATNVWSNGASSPVNLHHFQAVELNGLIYIPSSFTGSYPNETPLASVYYYDPAANNWGICSTIPAGRRRGAAGAVAHSGKIYVVGGITNGHVSGWVNWFDAYDPTTNTWTTLPNAPNARSHFQAAVHNNKLYVAGGHLTGAVNATTTGIAPIDVFDFATNTWTTLPASANLPTPRTGAATVVLNNELLVIGGFHPTQTDANKKVEALELTNLTWRNLASLNENRHGTQAIVSNEGIYIAAGASNNAETANNGKLESFYLFAPTQPGGTPITKGNLTPNPASVAFNYVAAGGTYTKSVTLTNSGGNQAIFISSVSLTGNAAFAVSPPANLPRALAPGQSINLTVTFVPPATGNFNATLNITTTGATPLVAIPLSGLVELYAARVNCGGPAFVSMEGKTFVPDNFFSGSASIFTTWQNNAINSTADDVLYQTQRNGYANSLTYNIPAPQAGTYAVTLHFAELTATAPAQRIFEVNIEGGPVELPAFDIFATAGAFNAHTKTYNNITVTDGFVTINFNATLSASAIAAIEIVMQSTQVAVAPQILFVVKNTTLNSSETTIKNRLETNGFQVQVINQTTATAASATGKNLVLISSSIDASIIAGMFKNVSVPVMTWDAFIYDDLAMTGTSSGTHFGSQTITTNQINITNPTHPLAAGLSGTVPVFTSGTTIMWGRPVLQSYATTVMTTASTKALIFGYNAGDAMHGGFIAPARRVGFFLHNNNANLLNTNGWALFDAAICWAMNCTATPPPPTQNTPPYFNITPTAITVDANFTTPQTVTVTPLPVPPADAAQTVTYTITPVAVPFANISINNNTGQVTITSVQGQWGNQVFTIIANDGQITNNTAVQTFMLTINQPTGGGGGNTGNFAVRINCGGPAYTDTNGNAFQADAYFSGDGTFATASNIAGTSNPALYKTERYGWSNNLSYNIPVPVAGAYNIKLHFAEIYWTTPGQRIFSVNMEGNAIELPNYDIIADAGASNTAVVKEFNNFTVADGILNINFSASVNAAKISAIEVLGTGGSTPPPITNTAPAFTLTTAAITVPANFTTPQVVTVTPLPVPPAEASQIVTYSLMPASVAFANVSINTATGQVTITSLPNQFGAQTFTLTANDGQTTNNLATQTFTLTVTQPTGGGGSNVAVRINCGGNSFTDNAGNVFQADTHFTGDGTFATLSTINGTPNSALYQTERYGWGSNLSYNIPVPVGYYTVKLHFAEIYWTAPGQRIFSVNIEGGPAELPNFDIIADAGAPNTAVVKQFDNIFVNDGTLAINFATQVNAAKISAIEVIGVTATAGGTTGSPTTGKTLLPVSETSDAANNNPIRIFPNPFANSFKLYLSNNYEGEVVINIVDLQGAIAEKRYLYKSNSDLYAVFELNELNAGLYILQIVTPEQIITKPIVKR